MRLGRSALEPEFRFTSDNTIVDNDELKSLCSDARAQIDHIWAAKCAVFLPLLSWRHGFENWRRTKVWYSRFVSFWKANGSTCEVKTRALTLMEGRWEVRTWDDTETVAFQVSTELSFSTSWHYHCWRKRGWNLWWIRLGWKWNDAEVSGKKVKLLTYEIKKSSKALNTFMFYGFI